MSSLERVVRPFQTLAVTPPRRLPPAAGASSPQNVSLTPGKSGGSAKTLSFSSSVEVTFYLDRHNKEKQPGGDGFERQMAIQRVRNPDDKSQFVDIGLSQKVTTQHGRGTTFRRDIGEYFGMNLGDADERSALFRVRNRADLEAAAAEFAAEHAADNE